jgi:hypothetical protein
MASDQFQDKLRRAYSHTRTWAECTWLMIDSTAGDSEYVASKVLDFIKTKQ